MLSILKKKKNKHKSHSSSISEIADFERGGYLMCKRSSFKTPFRSQCVHAPKTLLKLLRRQFHGILLLILGKLSWEMLLLVASEILRLLVNMLTANDKYSPRNMDNFPQQMQM